MKLSHLDQAGRARMVDVGDKPLMDRTAVATGTIRMTREAFQQVADQAVAKGDVLAVSEVAGTLAAKKRSEEHTSELQSQSNLVCRLLLEKKKKLKHAVAAHPTRGLTVD